MLGGGTGVLLGATTDQQLHNTPSPALLRQQHNNDNDNDNHYHTTFTSTSTTSTTTPDLSSPPIMQVQRDDGILSMWRHVSDVVQQAQEVEGSYR